MSTIFPREEKVETLFYKILENPRACQKLMHAFYEGMSNDEDTGLEEEKIEPNSMIFSKGLFMAYRNQDLSAFLMSVCGNSMFDLLRNALLIPLRFDDKGKENPILLSDEEGNIKAKVHIPLNKKQMFLRVYRKDCFLAKGFLEQHSFTEDMTIQTIENESHLGILMVQYIPDCIHKSLSDAQIYSVLWDYMMKLQDLLGHVFFYCGQFQEHYALGAFLPFTHFEYHLEKNMEVANGILFECIQELKKVSV